MFIYLFPFVLTAFFSVLYRLNILKNNNFFYVLVLLSLSIFSGFRFEVGPTDWISYKAFFDTLNLDKNILDLYQSKNQQFEIGYYCLNYLIKYLGWDYGAVFLASSLFISYALYKFTSHFSVNKFYILTIYIGYSYILLNFAQVRQSIAIGFFLLGCSYYLSHRGKLISLIIAALGILFQYSSIIYITILLAVIFLPRPKRRHIVYIFMALGLLIFITTFFTSFYSIIQLIPISVIVEKIMIYQDDQAEQAYGQLFLAGYLFLLTMNFIYNLKKVAAEEEFIVYYSIYIAFIACLAVLVFPGNYVMFSRILSVAAIFQAYAFALIMKQNRSLINSSIFIFTLAISFTYLYRLIYLYEDEFVPYNFNFTLLNF